jgi:hypothetical protein
MHRSRKALREARHDTGAYCATRWSLGYKWGNRHRGLTPLSRSR